MSFYRVGCDFIRCYRKNPNVLGVKLIFITAPDGPYEALAACGSRSVEITRTLCTILDGLPMDCSACHLKPICDEVEGMRELHFGHNGRAAEK